MVFIQSIADKLALCLLTIAKTQHRILLQSDHSAILSPE